MDIGVNAAAWEWLGSFNQISMQPIGILRTLESKQMALKQYLILL